MSFPEKIKKGFQMALKEEVDIIGSLASVLVKMGEEFAEPTEKRKLTLSMLHPKIIFRMLGAKLRSKREKRGILPKDLWHPKAIMTGGMDTAIYRDSIAYYWGSVPYQFYICVEAFYLAMQGWNKKEMTFVPDHAFLEFIPIEEIPKINEDKDYQPRTVLLNGVEEGKLYEVVITQFYGMPLLRYRMKDIVKFVALKDTETGVNLPQMVFQRRVDEAINLAGLAQLDEKTIWQAIANTGMKYTEWTACKEYDGDKSFLRIYLESKETKEPAELEKMIDEQLKIVDTDYSDIDAYLEFQPVRVTLVSPGTFQRYMDEKRKEGANPSHFKPIHVNPSAEAIQFLLKLSEVGEAR
jgi:phenylacetate-coenzyme A ligase PaaK-like adenylate-forming protein